MLIRKSDMIRVRTSSVKSSSTLFPFSIRAMYNIVNCDKKTSYAEVIYFQY